MQDPLHLIPNLQAIRSSVSAFERSLCDEFGMPLKVLLTLASNEHIIDAMAKLVSDTLHVPMSDMLSNTRFPDELEARQITMYLSNKHIPGIRLADIGRYFSKDHSTVISSCNRVGNLLDAKDAGMMQKVALCALALQKRLNSSTNETHFH